jgi:hypothetical protein
MAETGRGNGQNEAVSAEKKDEDLFDSRNTGQVKL